MRPEFLFSLDAHPHHVRGILEGLYSWHTSPTLALVMPQPDQPAPRSVNRQDKVRGAPANATRMARRHHGQEAVGAPASLEP